MEQPRYLEDLRVLFTNGKRSSVILPHLLQKRKLIFRMAASYPKHSSILLNERPTLKSLEDQGPDRLVLSKIAADGRYPLIVHSSREARPTISQSSKMTDRPSKRQRSESYGESGIPGRMSSSNNRDPTNVYVIFHPSMPSVRITLRGYFIVATLFE